MKKMIFSRALTFISLGALSVTLGGCVFLTKEAHYSFESPTALRKEQAKEFAKKNKMSFDEAYRLAVNYNRTKIVNLRYEVQPVGFVVGNDFFFPLEDSSDSPISGNGFYVNPKTKKVRFGDQESGKINLPILDRGTTGVRVSTW